MQTTASSLATRPAAERLYAWLLSGSPGFIEAVGQVRAALEPAVDELLSSRRVTSDTPASELAPLFAQTSLASEPDSFEDYVALLREAITQSVNMSSPRCLAHMTGAVPAFAAALSEVVACLNQNLVRRDASRVMSLIERQVLAMMHRATFDRPDRFYSLRAHAPDSSLGLFSSGGSLSNLAGLWIARHKAFPADGSFLGVEAHGLTAALRHHGWEGAVIICSRLAHYSVRRSAALLGIGEAGVVALEPDDRQRLDMRSLQAALAECARRRQRVVAIVGVAGNTDTGAIDPLAAIADLAHEHGTQLHVDAAWGGCWLFSPRLRGRLVGIENADTVAIDLHKQFHLPVGNSVLLVREPEGVAGLRQRASYILREDSHDLGEFSIEGSRSAGALLAHAMLHLVGPRYLGEWADATLDSAALLAGLIEASDNFQLLLVPETNIVLYRYVPPSLRTRALAGELTAREEARLNALNIRIHQGQLEGGRTLVSRTTVSGPGAGNAGVVALRAVIGNPRTTPDDVRAVLHDQVSIAAALSDD